MIERLKERWQVRNGWDVLVILIVFACTGFSVLYVKRGIFQLAGLTETSPSWLRWSVNILIILPLYQAILLAWGWVWGKFSFFWAFEKRMMERIGGLFRRKKR
ncbi:hypothetical protein DYBT9275_04672 [Dyadobacter sp. CECT 9275]|uniref:DUF6787 domain-containing protein n=1 Tax=Dyadobacter helix TaxID=2822344 RepID=A0A916JFV3_9BACT|nr:DUF6787 family protein [Dyadobacter sp. CECT 9275]CAG5010244.1 hypothetical protein DYBT9275_04672 [Dyadobacter sp. CECT 9275]